MPPGGTVNVIDLSALNLNSGANLDSLITDGFIFIVDEDKLFVDLDGDGTGDDILIATFTDGGGGFTLADDILV